MNGPKPPIDSADDLPDDVPNGDFTPDEPPVPVVGPVGDTDIDAPVEGRPLTDEEIGA